MEYWQGFWMILYNNVNTRANIQHLKKENKENAGLKYSLNEIISSFKKLIS